MIKGALIFAAGLALGYAKAVQDQQPIGDVLEKAVNTFDEMMKTSKAEREFLKTVRITSTPEEPETPEGEHPLAG